MTFSWWLCFAFLSLQVLSDCRITINTKNRIDDKDIYNESTKEYDPERFLVYPRVYHMAKRRRRSVDNGSMAKTGPDSTLLVIRTNSKTFYVELQSNPLLNEVPVHIREGDGRTVKVLHRTDCLKVGQILNHPGGVAAISTCSEDGTMTGILLAESKAYILEPLSPNYIAKSEEFSNITTERDGSIIPPHVLLQHTKGLNFCGVKSDSRFGSELADFPSEVSNVKSVNATQNIIRVKRADTSHRKVMEVAVFVDSELYAQIEPTSATDPRRATIRRVLGIMNQVQLVYNYASLDTKLKLVIVKLEILKPNASAPYKDEGNIDNYLDNFCNWQSKINTREGEAGHWDHAIMLTGLDLYKADDERKNSRVLGLAWVNGMCRSNYSCTLNEGTSFEAAFVIAHEMGHSLGIMHDGSGNNCDRNRFIMSDKTGPGKVNWSPCSNAYIKKFFRSGYGWCLDDDASPPNRSYDLQSQELPGLKYSLTDQCHLALGPDYIPYQDSKEPFNNVCRELWCAAGSWAKPAHPALDGSSCGSKKHCLQGSCRRERGASAVRRIGEMSSPTLSTRRSTRRTHTKDRDRDDDTFDFIDRTVLKMIRNLG